jgi:hypothetical protein
VVLKVQQGVCRVCQGYGLRGGGWLPEDQNFILEVEKTSLELVPLTVSFEACSQVWEKTRALKVSGKEIERMTLSRGAQIRVLQEREYEKEQKPILRDPAPRLYISSDGTFCHSAEKGKQRIEGRLGMVFTDKRAEISKGRNVLLEKRYCASFFGKDDFADQLEREALKFRIEEAGQVIFTADGEKALWKIKEERFPEALGILDWNHLSRKLTEALGVIESSSTRKEKTEAIREWLWKGQTEEALGKLKRLETQESKKKDLTERQIKRLKKLQEYRSYVEENKPWIIDYSKAHEEGFFVGSSIMESGINHMLANRLKKKRGRQWTRKGADSVARIVTTIANGDWQETWSKICLN